MVCGTEAIRHPNLSRDIVGQLTEDPFFENGTGGVSSWPNVSGGSEGKVQLPVHQRTDAIHLFEFWRFAPGKLPDGGLSNDRPDRRANSTP